MWSDESGLKECTKGNTHPPSPQWSWVGGIESKFLLYTFNFLCHRKLTYCQTVFQVSEWAVDYNVPGGADKEGWQYAADFPVYVPQDVFNVVINVVRKRSVTFVCLISPLQDISWPQNHERLC